ncbi:MAG: oxygen-dependent coproporphyrinogen oxidase [Planctomycetota bacterium]|nr:oxygen-dependent coproporphyrinogen oxidase [Planctomycetota bacterium]
MRERAVALMRELQDGIIAGLEDLDGAGTFCRDEWSRPGGGGGVTRVLAGGAVIEKGGVNVSEVHGHFSDEFARQVPGSGTAFFATGVSLVIHPESPHVPTVHANFRYIEHGDKSWFGGGADLTPYYFDANDKEHFHRVWCDVCAAHENVADYGRFSKWCDRYFYLPHRGERRGVGGIFFDHLWANDAVYAFVAAAGRSFLDAYLPVARRHKDEPVTAAQREWQLYRRGRYVEFNLIYDRGTTFGLKTGGRTESILMSLPPAVRWGYCYDAEPGTPEAALLDELRRPPPPDE